MNIVGKGKKVIDADLLARLAVNGQSGGTVSQAEVKTAIKAATADLKDEFASGSSTRGLARASDAVANTLELAVKSGWVKGGSAQSLIREYLDGAGKGSLSDVMKDIRADVRDNRGGGSVGYGGRSSSVSYSGGGSSRPATTTTRYAGT